MISIKNISEEEIAIITQIDTSVSGCRIREHPCPEPIRLKPGQETLFLGYEPGVLLQVRPVENGQIPRPTLRERS